MAEYIDKDYVTKCLMESWAHCGVPSDAKNKMLKWLNKAPTAADVQPARRGRWEWVEGHEGITCSVCGKRCNGPRIWWKYRYNVPFPAYCENCGARMDGAK